MTPLFGHRQEATALAVTLENGREVATAEMKAKAHLDKYKRYGAESTYEVKVRVEPENEPPFEATMKVPGSRIYLMSAGVRIRVKYDGRDKKVEFSDDPRDVRARNPQLDESEWQEWLQELLKREMAQ